MANLTQCPISRCLTESNYCESFPSANTKFQVIVIVVLPIVLAITAPLLSRLPIACRRDDDTPDDAKYSNVDPPMFLCGVGLLPLDCGASGLITVIWGFSLAFVVAFFSLLASPTPCDTALGACRTISCACGSGLVREGYVFMFCLLVLTSATLVQRFSSMAQHHRVQHRLIKPTLILGSLLLALTGVFPEKYDTNGSIDGVYTLLYSLHLLGVFGASTALMLVPFGWFFEHWYTHRQEVPLRSLLARAAYVLSTLGFGMAFMNSASDSKVQDSVVQFCHFLTDEESCNGYPLLSPGNCAEAQSALKLSDNIVQPNFLCKWVPNSQLSNWTRLVAPPSYVESSSCVRHECPLGEYARGVALEFAVLFLTLTYVPSFAIHDVRRLLNRPPPEARRPVLDAVGEPSYQEPLQLAVEQNAGEQRS